MEGDSLKKLNKIEKMCLQMRMQQGKSECVGHSE